MNELHSSNTTRIAKNTLFLYGRSLVTMLISVYTSRVILNILGVNDYGIYNVVGGVVAMFTMLSSTFSSATQRFLSFDLGRNNSNRVKDVFSTSINIHFVLAFIIFIIMEIVGPWFLNYKMNIPRERLYAANFVLQCSIITFIIDLISIPYNAAIIAYEKMDAFAYITIFEAFMKLAILYLLIVILFDKLIVYAILMMGIAILIRLIYGIYCGRYLKECRYRKVSDKSLYKEMLGISGWNFLGSSASILTAQGMNLLLNLFGGGVVVNAAKGIASQVQNAIAQLVNNFMVSLKPQITKSYATNDQNYMISLISRGSRFSFYLMCMLCLPIIFETEIILHLWLKIVPVYTVAFVRLTLIYIMVMPFSTLLDAAILASGLIRNSQIVLSIIQFLNFPISYFILKLGYPPYSIYFIYIVLSWCSLATRLYFTHNSTSLSYSYYLKSVVLNSLIVVSISLIVPFIIVNFFSQSIVRFIILCAITEMVSFLTVYFVGLNHIEREFFKNKIKGFIS